MRRLNREQPLMSPESYKTFQFKKGIATKTRKATCEEVECQHYINGWATIIDESSEQGQMDGYIVRQKAGRVFEEERTPEGLTKFIFRAGQPCFAASAHVVPLETKELYVVKEGDWRGNPRRVAPRSHVRPEHWVEEFSEHQDKLKRQIERG